MKAFLLSYDFVLLSFPLDGEHLFWYSDCFKKLGNDRRQGKYMERMYGTNGGKEQII